MESDIDMIDAGFKIDITEDNMTKMIGTLPGPPDTPYFGGLYKVEITIPDDYPFAPPEVDFVSKIWHPNVSSMTGAICLDILTPDSWSAAMSLRTVLLSIQALLASPEPNDPLDSVVAGQFMDYHEVYIKTAKHWASVYASSQERVHEYEDMVEQVEKITGMGEDRARHVLSCCGWDLKVAVGNICS